MSSNPNSNITVFLKDLKALIITLLRLTKKYDIYNDVKDFSNKFNSILAKNDQHIVYISIFMKNIDKYIVHILNRNESLFSDDIFAGNVNLLIKLNFKQIWKLDNITTDTKDKIWTLFKLLCIEGRYILKQHDRSVILNKKTLESIEKYLNTCRIQQLIKDEAERLNKEEDISDNKFGDIGGICNIGKFNLEQLMSFFADDDNVVVILIKKVIDDFEIPLSMKNPVSFIQNIFSNNADELKSIITVIITNVCDKMTELKVTDDDLRNDLNKIISKVSKKLNINSDDLMKNGSYKSIFDNIKSTFNDVSGNKNSDDIKSDKNIIDDLFKKIDINNIELQFNDIIDNWKTKQK
jgi:hypothetical protein